MRYLLLSLLVVSFSVSAQTDQQRAAIAERIKSYSMVCVTGEPCNVGSSDDMTVAESEIVADIPVEAALPGKAKYGTCIACHGANGGGGIGPALAGQDVEYLVGRLNSYRAKEQVGPMSSTMYPMAAGLSDQDILDLAEYATSL